MKLFDYFQFSSDLNFFCFFFKIFPPEDSVEDDFYDCPSDIDDCTSQIGVDEVFSDDDLNDGDHSEVVNSDDSDDNFD